MTNTSVRWLAFLGAFIFSGCSAGIAPPTVPGAGSKPQAGTTISIPTSRSTFDISRRFMHRDGKPAHGRKLQGASNAYWFPESARIRKHGNEVYIFAYNTLWLFPRQLRHVDNASNTDVAFEAIPDETFPQIVALAERAKAKKSARSTDATRRARLVVFGNCDVWDPDCICPDCVGASNPWSEQPPADPLSGGGYGGGGGSTAYDPTYDCLALSGGDDTSFAACMAAGGPFNLGSFGKFFRSNCRSFTYYVGNRGIVLSTGSNPVRGGATYYDAKYSGILQGFQEDAGPLPNGLVIADYINYALFGSIDGVFAAEEVDFTDSLGGFMYVSDATFATISFSAFVATQGPWSSP